MYCADPTPATVNPIARKAYFCMYSHPKPGYRGFIRDISERESRVMVYYDRDGGLELMQVMFTYGGEPHTVDIPTTARIEGDTITWTVDTGSVEQDYWVQFQG